MQSALCICCFIFLSLILNTCGNTLKITTIQNDKEFQSRGLVWNKLSENAVGCDELPAFSPDDEFRRLIPPRNIRVAIHFMNSSDSSQNYFGDEAIQFARSLVHMANQRLEVNAKMNLPAKNNTLALNAHYRYFLHEGDKSIYFHFDDRLYFFNNKGRNRNNYDRKIIEKYAVGIDSIANVFIMPHHPDSVLSKQYSANASGIALGNAIKISIRYDLLEGFWKYCGVFNHEMGHLLGLKHSWNDDDGCEDTPKNPNCWNKAPEPPCNELNSNNLMDYNVSQQAITPCQLGIIHRNFSTPGSRQRKILDKNWCRKDTTSKIVLEPGEHHWSFPVELTRDVILKKGCKLFAHCRLSVSPETSITVEPGAELMLFGGWPGNDCGGDWAGIKLLRRGSEKAKVYFQSPLTGS